MLFSKLILLFFITNDDVTLGHGQVRRGILGETLQIIKVTLHFLRTARVLEWKCDSLEVTQHMGARTKAKSHDA